MLLKFLPTWLLLHWAILSAVTAQAVFINEIHYDNFNQDQKEAIEIAGPAGTDLSNWQLVLYNGAENIRAPYSQIRLERTIPDQANGCGVIHIELAPNGLQNGGPDGIALLNAEGKIIQFLSYEGSFTALSGPAQGETSIDIGQSESEATMLGQSIQLQGEGEKYEDFTWVAAQSESFGRINPGQIFGKRARTVRNDFLLLISEVVVQPNPGEFVEIYNPGDETIDLSQVYLSDASFARDDQFYFQITRDPARSGGGRFGDFHVRFPEGASIPPRSYQTLALNGWENFRNTYSVEPDYEIPSSGEENTVPDMREAFPGSIEAGGNGGLSNSGEMLILYFWNGQSDLVQDLDYVLWGDRAEAFDKTGIRVDGPDADTLSSVYENDTPVEQQAILAQQSHALGLSWQRVDFEEGQERKSGSNGVQGHDETSENLNQTFRESLPSPGRAVLVDTASGKLVKIHQIQGVGLTSPFANLIHTIEGIVVGDFQGPERLNGFFVQEEAEDVDSLEETSEGIFVRDGNFGVDVRIGDQVRVRGAVQENDGLTQLFRVSLVEVLVRDQELPAQISLGFPSGGFNAFEKYEGMRVIFQQEPLFLGDLFNYGRYGELRLAAQAPQVIPTNRVSPGDPARALLEENIQNFIILDDEQDTQNREDIAYRLADGSLPRRGARIERVAGILSDGFRSGSRAGAFPPYRIRPTKPEEIQFLDNPQVPENPPTVAGRLQVACFNVLNLFFNIDECGPLKRRSDCRGADNLEERNRQLSKLTTALTRLNADIVGLQELENNAQGDPTLQLLVDSLNRRLGANVYSFIATGPIGAPQPIKVGIIYKTARVRPRNNFQVLTRNTPGVSPVFDERRSRAALAQSFEEISSGEVFTLCVNHLKSKGPSGMMNSEDPNFDQGDGQGYWNRSRTEAARALVNWLEADPTNSQDPDILIVGDMNSYRREDPIVAFKDAGYRDLVDEFSEGVEPFTFVFYGQAGALDYTLANPSLRTQVRDAATWPINSLVASALDYNTFNQDFLYDPTSPFRSSDHDPILLGLDLGEQVSTLPIPPPDSENNILAVRAPQSGEMLVFDGRGVVIKRLDVEQGELRSIDLQEEPDGLYLVKLVSEKGLQLVGVLLK